MKKALYIILSLLLVIALTGCSDANENQTGTITSTSENAASNTEQKPEENEGIKLADGTIIYCEGKTADDAQIEFKDENGNIVLTASDILKVSARYFSEECYGIQLEFTEDGAQKFTKITQENLGKTINIYLNGELVVSPVINSVINDNKTKIVDYSFDKEKVLKLYETLT